MTSTLLRRLGPILLGGSVALGITATAKSEEIRIGFLAPTTGVFAQVGKDMVDGFKMYLDEKNNKLGGADIKFIVEDEQGKPDTAVTKAKKLILQDKVHFFVGGLLASTGYALAPVSTAEKVVYISPVSSADDLTQRDLPKYPYFFRTGWNSSQPSHPFGQWACEQGYKKIAIIAADYAFGYEVVRRLPARVRSLRRADRPEDLAPAHHQGFRALHPDAQGGRRRDLHRDGRPDVAAIPQATGSSRQQEAGDRRRSEL